MPHIPVAFCECGHEFVIEKNEVLVTVTCGSLPDGYYTVMTDRYRCPSCGAGILRPAQKAYSEHYDTERFARDVEASAMTAHLRG